MYVIQLGYSPNTLGFGRASNITLNVCMYVYTFEWFGFLTTFSNQVKIVIKISKRKEQSRIIVRNVLFMAIEILWMSHVCISFLLLIKIIAYCLAHLQELLIREFTFHQLNANLLWPGSFAFAEWLVQHKSWIEGKRIIELGRYVLFPAQLFTIFYQ